MANQLPFSKGEYVVYPTHGVGKVTGIETREIAGEKLKLFVILFDKEKMTLLFAETSNTNKSGLLGRGGIRLRQKHLVNAAPDHVNLRPLLVFAPTEQLASTEGGNRRNEERTSDLFGQCDRLSPFKLFGAVDGKAIGWTP